MALTQPALLACLSTFTESRGKSCFEQLGRYDWSDLGSSPSKAAHAPSLLAMAPLLEPLFEASPKAEVNYVPLVTALEACYEDRPWLQHGDVDTVKFISRTSGSIRAALLHCRRLKQQVARWKQATRFMNSKDTIALHTLLSKASHVPWKDEQAVRAAAAIGVPASWGEDVFGDGFDAGAFAQARFVCLNSSCVFFDAAHAHASSEQTSIQPRTRVPTRGCQHPRRLEGCGDGRRGIGIASRGLASAVSIH